MRTLETTLSGSSGPHGPASSSHQYCIASQEAAEGMILMVVVVGVSLVEDGARAPRAPGAEDPSLAIERPTKCEGGSSGMMEQSIERTAYRHFVSTIWLCLTRRLTLHANLCTNITLTHEYVSISRK